MASSNEIHSGLSFVWLTVRELLKQSTRLQIRLEVMPCERLKTEDDIKPGESTHSGLKIFNSAVVVPILIYSFGKCIFTQDRRGESANRLRYISPKTLETVKTRAS